MIFPAVFLSAFATVAAQAACRAPGAAVVKGYAFDRLAIIYFENTNYDKAAGDENFAWLARQGIKLSGYYGVTHPSQPNYIASIAGDYFGLVSDGRVNLPSNVSTVLDLLESKRISWAHYQEDMPYTAFDGDAYKNQQNGRNDYVRKHNPAIHFDNVHTEHRLGQIKNLSRIDTSRSMFHKDLAADTLPQWMFITPNMTSDGHDSDVTTGGVWARAFLEPLLQDPNFMKNTMVLITWDEAEITPSAPNNILAVLIGDAIPKELIGTEDKSFYTHYSEIATVSANWDLPTLGRWDVGANVFQWVGNKTGDIIRSWTDAGSFRNHYYATPYAGFLNSDSNNTHMPKPNLALDPNHAGRHILQSVKEMWANSSAVTYYTDSIEVADGRNPPPGFDCPDC